MRYSIFEFFSNKQRVALVIQNTCQPTKIMKVRDDKEWMTPKIKMLIKTSTNKIVPIFWTSAFAVWKKIYTNDFKTLSDKL